jgi:Tol biopolymer transport system component
MPTGLGNVRVSADLVTGGNVEVFEWSPDGSRLAYRADQELDTQQSLYVAPAAGGAVVELSGDVFDVGVGQFAWAPDGSRVAYFARQDSPLFAELYTVRANGTENLRVSANFIFAGTLSDLLWSPTSARLAYLADVSVQGTQELHVTGAQGGSVQVSGPSQTGQSVQTYDWSTDGASLCYVAPSVNFDKSELFVTVPGGVASLLSAAMQGAGDVLDFQIPGRD